MRFALDGGPKPRELTPVGPKELLVREGTTRYTFSPATKSKPAQLVRRAEGEAPQTFVRFDRVSTLGAQALAEYAGRYGSDELPRDVEMSVRGGALIAGPWGAQPWSSDGTAQPLEPLTRDTFVLFGIGAFGW